MSARRTSAHRCGPKMLEFLPCELVQHVIALCKYDDVQWAWFGWVRASRASRGALVAHFGTRFRCSPTAAELLVRAAVEHRNVILSGPASATQRATWSDFAVALRILMQHSARRVKSVSADYNDIYSGQHPSLYGALSMRCVKINDTSSVPIKPVANLRQLTRSYATSEAKTETDVVVNVPILDECSNLLRQQCCLIVHGAAHMAPSDAALILATVASASPVTARVASAMLPGRMPQYERRCGIQLVIFMETTPPAPVNATIANAAPEVQAQLDRLERIFGRSTLSVFENRLRITATQCPGTRPFANFAAASMAAAHPGAALPTLVLSRVAASRLEDQGNLQSQAGNGERYYYINAAKVQYVPPEPQTRSFQVGSGSVTWCNQSSSLRPMEHTDPVWHVPPHTRPCERARAVALPASPSAALNARLAHHHFRELVHPPHLTLRSGGRVVITRDLCDVSAGTHDPEKHRITRKRTFRLIPAGTFVMLRRLVPMSRSQNGSSDWSAKMACSATSVLAIVALGEFEFAIAAHSDRYNLLAQLPICMADAALPLLALPSNARLSLSRAEIMQLMSNTTDTDVKNVFRALVR